MSSSAVKKPKKSADFIRGKPGAADQTTTGSAKGRRSAATTLADDQLFSVRKRRRRDDSEKVSAKKSRKKSKSDANNANDDEDLLRSATAADKIIIESMSLSKLPVGIVIYGCVQQITDFELKLSLSGGIVANVSIANISNSYTRLLESFATLTADGGQPSPDMEVLKPSGMFRIGQCFPVRVLSKSEKSGGFANIDIKASINPRDIYSDLKASSILKVPKMAIIAAVDSVEDHGFVMDIGFDDVKAFLPKDKAQPAIQSMKGRKTLAVGQLLWCAIDSVSNDRSVRLTTTAKALSKFKLTADSDAIAAALTPGLAVSATVVTVADRGLEVSVVDDFKGFVPRNHLKTDWDFPKNMYKIGERIEGTVLYRHPITKQFALSLKPRLDPKTVKQFLQTVKVGAIMEEAVVAGRDDMGNVVFKLANGVKAIAHKKHLFDKESEDVDMDSVYGIGSRHKCRVKSINLMDQLVVVTLKKSLLDSPYLSIDELEVGSLVKGSVKKLCRQGVVVELGIGLRGFVPNHHLAETAQLKHREQLFPMGRQVKCRVFRLDKSCTPCKMSLTCKKSLLNKKLAILSSYEEAVPGFATDGVVALIHKKGLLVEFFNDVKGFIPLKYLSSTRIEFPEKVFTVGQIVKCSVVSTDVETERITCSLIGVKDIKTSKNNKNSTLTVGQVLRKMKVTNKSDNGLDLADEAKGYSVFLPVDHLADDHQTSAMLSEAVAVGDVIKEVVVFTIKTSLVIVSRKGAFISAAKNKTFISSVGQLEPNVVVPVVVNGFASYGIFVEMANNIKGLVPKRYLIDGAIDEPKNLGFSLYQTVLAKFVDFEEQTPEDVDKKVAQKLAFSLKLSHVWNKRNDPFSDRVHWFDRYSADTRLALDLFCKNGAADEHKLYGYRVGEIVNYRIVESDDVTEVSATARHIGDKKVNSVRALISKCPVDSVREMDSDYKVGATGEAVVVGLDLADQRVVIVINQRLVKQIKNSVKVKAVLSAKCEQIIKSTPIYICPQYVLVVLSGHVPGLLAYIPGRRHPNDVHGISHLFSLFNAYHVIIKSVTNDKVIAVLKPDKEPAIRAAKSNAKESTKIVTTAEESVNKENAVTKRTNGFQVTADKKAAKVVETKPTRVSAGKRRLDSESEELAQKVVPIANETDAAKAKRFKRDVLKVNAPFSWTVEDATPDLNRMANALTAADNSAGADHSSSDSDSDVTGDSDEENPKRRQTRSERNEEVRNREALLRKKEELLMDTERTPETEEDYERSALASPNSSLVWLKYMAYHLEQSRADSARAVAERALKTITFREERERLNVWFASLNLETMYGSQQTVDEVFGRAVQFNEPVLVYQHLADVYAKSGKAEAAELLYHQMLKKFRQNKSVWIAMGMFYMKTGRREATRRLMQRALPCLQKREHMEVITKFAQMEFRLGDVEYGKTLFENVLANFPKRVDVWSVYIDMMVKYGVKEGDNSADNDEMVRNIFERVITFKLAAKQMRFVFKRYIDFETQRDNYDRIERIKHKAMEYVEGKTIT